MKTIKIISSPSEVNVRRINFLNSIIARNYFLLQRRLIAELRIDSREILKQDIKRIQRNSLLRDVKEKFLRNNGTEDFLFIFGEVASRGWRKLIHFLCEHVFNTHRNRQCEIPEFLTPLTRRLANEIMTSARRSIKLFDLASPFKNCFMDFSSTSSSSSCFFYGDEKSFNLTRCETFVIFLTEKSVDLLRNCRFTSKSQHPRPSSGAS